MDLIHSSTAARLLTSTTVPVIVPPVDLISSTSFSKGLAWTSATERTAPRSARSLVVARPIPEAAPVRAMTFPWNLVDIFRIESFGDELVIWVMITLKELKMRLEEYVGESRSINKPFSAPAYGCKTGEIRATRLYYLLTRLGSGRRNIIFSGAAWRGSTYEAL